MTKLQIDSFTLLRGHTYVRALAEVSVGGLRLRGLKLEERRGEFRLGMPGRKVRGAWQTVLEIEDRKLAGQVRDLLVERYRKGAA